MQVLRILGIMAGLALAAFAALLVWSGLYANDMISRCHDNSAEEYIPDFEARKAYCGEFGASASAPLPRDY